MSAELFEKILLEGATEGRWSRVYTAAEMLQLIKAATPEQINYVHFEGKNKGKSVLWLVAQDCNFLNDKQYEVFEYLLSLSDKDAINARSKEDTFSNYECEPERSVLSLVARTTGFYLFKQFKLIATMLEKGARLDIDRETQLFWAVKSSYEDAISLCVPYSNFKDTCLDETINAIKSMRENYAFIIANLSKLCLEYAPALVFHDYNNKKMAEFIRRIANDFISRTFAIVTETRALYADFIDEDDINTLRELLEMFKSDPGKALLDYCNNTALLSHALLAAPQQAAASARKKNKIRAPIFN